MTAQSDVKQAAIGLIVREMNGRPRVDIAGAAVDAMADAGLLRGPKPPTRPAFQAGPDYFERVELIASQVLDAILTWNDWALSADDYRLTEVKATATLRVALEKSCLLRGPRAWTDEQVDGLARHLCLVENGGPKPWAELAEETQDVWRSRARRALAAVEEASS